MYTTTSAAARRGEKERLMRGDQKQESWQRSTISCELKGNEGQSHISETTGRTRIKRASRGERNIVMMSKE